MATPAIKILHKVQVKGRKEKTVVLLIPPNKKEFLVQIFAEDLKGEIALKSFILNIRHRGFIFCCYHRL